MGLRMRELVWGVSVVAATEVAPMTTSLLLSWNLVLFWMGLEQEVPSPRLGDMTTFVLLLVIVILRLGLARLILFGSKASKPK